MVNSDIRDAKDLNRSANKETKDGFRLYHVQLLNWGTWHKDVSTFKVYGKDALLTGDNGSGKSTLVDAITTLLIPRKSLEFNMASGDKKDSRNLKSYVLGYYKSTADDDFGKKNIGLRDNQSFLTIILCAFYNALLDEYVTIAQIMYADPNKNDAVNVSHYIVCQRLLDIKQDLSALGSNGRAIGTSLKKRGIEYYSDFKNYRHKFMQYLGIPSEQALSLFCQAISLKKVENISTFVRSYMLSFKDPGVDRLIQHYRDLLNVHQILEVARSQEKLLTPLVENVDIYDRYRREQALYELCSLNLETLYASFKKDPLYNVLKDTENKKALCENKIEKLNEKSDKLSIEFSDTQFAIAQNGGMLLTSLEERQRRLESDITRTDRNLALYKDNIALVSMVDDTIKAATSDAAFIEQKELLNSIKTQCEVEKGSIFNERDQIIALRGSSKKKIAALESEIESLAGRSSNISLNQIRMRQNIVDDLELDEEDLPFAGELIEVKNEDKALWEGAIERVLHGFALSLLVRDDLYPLISDYVERHNLKVKLVYYRVNSAEYENEFKTSEVIYKNSLVNKVKIKPDMGCFTNYVRSEIVRRFNFVCVEDMVKFRIEKKAITPQGQIKFSETRHEKDDRSRIDDRSHFVLGWTNKDKIAYIKKSLENLKKELNEIEKSLRQKESEYNGILNSINCITRILEIEKFSDIDVKTLKSELKDIISKIEYQKKHNVTLQSLKDKLSEIAMQQRKTQDSIKNESMTLGSINKSLDMYAELIKSNDELLAQPLDLENTCNIKSDDVKALFDALIEKNRALHELKLGSRIFAENVFAGTYNAINRHLSEKEREINELKEELSSAIISAMSDFKTRFADDARDLDASVEAAPYYRSYLDRIREEDLPRHVDKFKRVLHEHTINHITAFSVDLDNIKETIRKKVAEINTSLKSIDYSDNTFIELIAVDSKDQDIKTFREDMRQCTLMAGDDGDDLQKAEARFNTIKAFIDVFINRENHVEADKRYTQKVTDVRNWFNFVVRENSRIDNTEVNLYADTDGKSGGEKVKLAYSILASSLAYQYGTGSLEHRSFRLAVIDEAFAHGSDDGSSEYALQLFNKLNIQLMVVTPNSKISLIENYVQSVGHVIKRNNVSTLQNMTIEVFRRLKEQSATRARNRALSEDSAAVLNDSAFYDEGGAVNDINNEKEILERLREYMPRTRGSGSDEKEARKADNKSSKRELNTDFEAGGDAISDKAQDAVMSYMNDRGNNSDHQSGELPADIFERHLNKEKASGKDIGRSDVFKLSDELKAAAYSYSKESFSDSEDDIYKDDELPQYTQSDDVNSKTGYMSHAIENPAEALSDDILNHDEAESGSLDKADSHQERSGGGGLSEGVQDDLFTSFFDSSDIKNSNKSGDIKSSKNDSKERRMKDRQSIKKAQDSEDIFESLRKLSKVFDDGTAISPETVVKDSAFNRTIRKPVFKVDDENNAAERQEQLDSISNAIKSLKGDD